MKPIILFIIFSYSLSLIVFPFQARENEAKSYESPINQTKLPIKKYLNHILNHFEFLSYIEVGSPKQKVVLQFNFDDNYLTLLSRTTSISPYYYNKSSSYKELIVNDPNCNIKVFNSVTIKEILYMKNKFYSNLNDFISSKDEISHEFIIVFSKVLPKIVNNKFVNANNINIGLLVNTRYKDEHGIYKPFLNEVIEQGYIENYTYFLYYFDEYKESIYHNDSNSDYEGLFVFGKYPHELLPNKYDKNNLYWTNTFLTYSQYSDYENILWGIQFNQVYIDYENGLIEDFEHVRGIFDLNVEFILPPNKYYKAIEKFFRPLEDICHIETNQRLFNKDGNIYNMIYCDYEEFGKKYLKTFPKLVFKIDDFDEEFEFTYKDLFRPIYDNKYYLFLIFSERFDQHAIINQPKNYPWTLGRIFFKKYQFVFNYLNKTVGYYKVKSTEIKTDTIDTTDNIIPSDKTDEATDKVSDNISDIVSDGVTDDTMKESDNDNNNQNDGSDKNDGKDPKNSKEKENLIKNNYSGDVLLVISIIVWLIIVVLIIGICYYCFCNKKKRKKKMNELVDENEYLSEEDEKKSNE